MVWRYGAPPSWSLTGLRDGVEILYSVGTQPWQPESTSGNSPRTSRSYLRCRNTYGVRLPTVQTQSHLLMIDRTAANGFITIYDRCPRCTVVATLRYFHSHNTRLGVFPILKIHQECKIDSAVCVGSANFHIPALRLGRALECCYHRFGYTKTL
jgi:hypothetical protein